MEICHLNGDAAIHQYSDYSVELVVDMDLTGFIGRSMLKDELSDTTGVDFAIEFVERTAPATIRLSLTNGQTADLLPKSYHWDLWVRSGSSGAIVKLCKGLATVEAGVTPNVNLA